VRVGLSLKGGVAMSAGRIILLVFGVIVVLISIGMLFAGSSLLWLDRTRMDSEGFISSNTVHIERDSHAIVTGPISIDEVALDVLNWIGIATDFGAEVSNNSPSKGIFIGVAEKTAAEAYLNNVNYDELTLSNRDWLSLDIATYTNHPGDSTPASPTSQTFWVVSAHGTGVQTMQWETEVGSHSIVLMNDDGSAGVDLNAVYKVKVPSVFGWSIGLLVGGILVLIIGSFMIYLAVRKPQDVMEQM
jgi:hypothetical protein